MVGKTKVHEVLQATQAVHHGVLWAEGAVGKVSVVEYNCKLYPDPVAIGHTDSRQRGAAHHQPLHA